MKRDSLRKCNYIAWLQYFFFGWRNIIAYIGIYHHTWESWENNELCCGIESNVDFEKDYWFKQSCLSWHTESEAHGSKALCRTCMFYSIHLYYTQYPSISSLYRLPCILKHYNNQMYLVKEDLYHKPVKHKSKLSYTIEIEHNIYFTILCILYTVYVHV